MIIKSRLISELKPFTITFPMIEKIHLRMSTKQIIGIVLSPYQAQAPN